MPGTTCLFVGAVWENGTSTSTANGVARATSAKWSPGLTITDKE